MFMVCVRVCVCVCVCVCDCVFRVGSINKRPGSFKMSTEQRKEA